MRSSCDCGYLRGPDSYLFQPFIGVMRFQPFLVVLLALCVASSISRRQRACVKGTGKDYKGEKELNCFQARKIEAQASSLIHAESLFGQESSIDFTRNDVRSAVVTECPENQFEAAAAFGTCRSQSEKLEAANVQSGQNVHFSSKGWEVVRRRLSGEVGMLHWARVRGSRVLTCMP